MEQNKQNISLDAYTVKQLRELNIISSTDGRPSKTLTDSQWQKEFSIRKQLVQPFPKGTKKLTDIFSDMQGRWNSETSGAYIGDTNWQYYCQYINDVLDNLRHNQIDYCYFIYQINDLLRFYPDTLKTKYCDGYWEVWLDNNG